MAYKDTILSDSPLGYWPLDDLTGNIVVADHSGHGYNGTLVGTNLYGVDGATSLLGKAMAFASGGSHVKVPSLDGHLPVGGDPYTIECWAWMDVPPYGTPGTGEGCFVFWGDWTPNVAGPYACNALINDQSNNLRAVWSGDDTGSFWVYSLTTTVDWTLWHHVAVTCDGTTDTLYVDGTQVATQASYNTHWLGHNFQIGAFLGEDWVLHGSLQHVAVYTSALSPERLAAHHAAAFPYQNAVLADEPAAYWPLQESAGFSWTDIGAHGYTLSAPVDPEPGVSGPLSGTNAVRFRLGGDIGGTQTGLDTHPPFCVEAWINIAAASDPRGYGGDQPILFWGDPTHPWVDGALDSMWIAAWTHASPSGAGVNLNYSGGGLGLGIGSVPTLDGAWHHFALTWDSGNTLKVYIDGALETTLTDIAPATLASPSSGVFSIGGVANFGNDSLSWCDLAYVALYPTALSATRITAHFSATTNSALRTAILADAPSAFWPLQET